MAGVRIWLACDHHAAFRCGGWAYVREAAGERWGAAGGERYVGAERIALIGLAAAIADLPASTEVTVATADKALLGRAAVIAGEDPGEDAPTEDLDLWARVLAAGKGRKLRLVRADAAASAARFCAAWAELARDKAKMKGAFTSPIPKPNLAKVKLD